MTTGLTTDDDLDCDKNLCKTAMIDRELMDRQIDIAAFQVTRLLETGYIREQAYTFHWSVRPAGSSRQHGVGFAIKNSLSSVIHGPVAVSERIFWLHLTMKKGFLTIVSVYAATLCLPLKTKMLSTANSVVS